MNFDKIVINNKKKLEKVLESLKKEFCVEIDFDDAKSLEALHETAQQIFSSSKLNESFGKHLSTKQNVCAKMILDAIELNESVKDKTMTKKSKKVTTVNENVAGIDQAQLVLASKSIVDELQSVLEDLGNLQIKKLPPIVERMKVEQGLDAANSYNTEVSALLDAAIQSVTAAKDGVDNLTLKMSGDVDMSHVGNDLSADLPVEDEIVDDVIDGHDNSEVEIGVDQGSGERERKNESVGDSDIMKGDVVSFEGKKYTVDVDDAKGGLLGIKAGDVFKMVKKDKVEKIHKPRVNETKKSDASKCVLVVETKLGKTGKKTFETVAEAKKWLVSNGHKIKSVKKQD